VDTIREENWGGRRGPLAYWDDYRKKNRYSLFFTEADLEHFELVSASADRPTMEPIRPGKSSPLQLALPFTEAALYRGPEVVDTFEMLI
jgi:hypothetical protein